MRRQLGFLLVVALSSCGLPNDAPTPPDAEVAVDSGYGEGPAEVVRTAIVPWPEATEVRLFVEDLPPQDDDSDPTMSNPAGTRLNGRQRTALGATLSKIEVSGGESDVEIVAGCFFPHHFFRFFDSGNRQIGEIAVCYCCGNERATPALVEDADRTYFRVDMEKLTPLIVELGYPTDVNC